MFDGWLPEIGDLAALDDAAIVDAAGGWARVEAAACARKQAAIAETFCRRTGLPADERELWWVDPEAEPLHLVVVWSDSLRPIANRCSVIQRA